ncbi:MAG: hypothetical protein ABII72_02555 [Parcubacteria group bacterium]
MQVDYTNWLQILAQGSRLGRDDRPRFPPETHSLLTQTSSPNKGETERIEERRCCLLLSVFKRADKWLTRREVDLISLLAQVRELRGHLHPFFTLGTEAALAKHILMRQEQLFNIAVVYGALGSTVEEVLAVAKRKAQELEPLLTFVNFSIIAVTSCLEPEEAGERVVEEFSGGRVTIQVIPRQKNLIVAFPGIKAPSVMTGLQYVVTTNEKTDFVVTTDGSESVLMFQCLTLLQAMWESDQVSMSTGKAGIQFDAVLGSRRLPGSYVLKPFYRVLSSFWFHKLVYCNFRDTLPDVSDPQSPLKLYRFSSLKRSLEKMGADPNSGRGFPVHSLDGSFAFEIQVVSALAGKEGGRPQIAECPVADIVAYPQDVVNMQLIFEPQHRRRMAEGLKRHRAIVEGDAIFDEGTECLVTSISSRKIRKLPRSPLRAAPIPRTADSNVVSGGAKAIVMLTSLPMPLNHLFLLLAARRQQRGYFLSANYAHLAKSAAASHLIAASKVKTDTVSIMVPLILWPLLKLENYLDEKSLLLGAVLLNSLAQLPSPLIQEIGAGLEQWRDFSKLLAPLRRFLKRKAIVGLEKLITLIEQLERAIQQRVYWLLEQGDAHLGRELWLLCYYWEKLGDIKLLRDLGYFSLRWLDDIKAMLSIAKVPYTPPLSQFVDQERARPLIDIIRSGIFQYGIKEQIHAGLQLYEQLGDLGFYDLELRFDNLGYVGTTDAPRLVLIDPGSVIVASELWPTLVLYALRKAREDIVQSAHLEEIRQLAGNNLAEMYKVSCLGLFDHWIKQEQARAKKEEV